MRNRTAFTLIELLVVVAIITALIAILVPSLNRATEFAKRAKCMSNLHQIAVGTIALAGEKRGVTPVYKTWTAQFITDNVQYAKDGRPTLTKIANNPDFYYCPSHAVLNSETPNAGWKTNSVERIISYSPIGIWDQGHIAPYQSHRYMNMPNTPWSNRPKTIGAVRIPSDTAIVTDGQASWYNTVPGFTYPGDGVWPGTPTYYTYYAYPHRDGADAWAGGNTAMFDGAAKWTDFNDMFHPDEGYTYGAKYSQGYISDSILGGLYFW